MNPKDQYQEYILKNIQVQETVKIGVSTQKQKEMDLSMEYNQDDDRKKQKISTKM